jgi:single-strand DNA-binding protein
MNMAEGLNRVMLLGNLGADPELKSTQSGDSVLKLRLATTERYLDRNKAWQERTEWHSVTVWGKRGEGLHRILAKGSTIFVEGSLRTSSYEKDGVKRYTTEVVAQNIILAGGRSGRAAGEGEFDGGGHGAGRPAQERPAQRPQPGRGAPPAEEAGAGGEDFDPGYGGSDDDIPFLSNRVTARSELRRASRRTC